jgi:alkanesulfonate monooxygenase SsuD/methylene tetrahydromethanopterin reductase-like flavin-dependent oxidoreductase (luciferase family)
MARLAEDAGFDAVWVEDHLLLRLEGEEPQGLWEGWSVMCALAAVTSRIAIGSFVTCTAFRNPALLAKMADTLDEISGGRLILGLGAGWNETDFSAFGYSFDRRVARFEEALAIIATLLREGRITHTGRFYQARECELRPRGPRQNGPPIMVGAEGERMLRLTARFADAWNGPCRSPEDYPALRERVDAACCSVGRDPATLSRAVAVLVDFTGGAGIPRSFNPARLPPLAGPPDRIADVLKRLGEQGVSHVQLTPIPMAIESVARLTPVLERM